MENNLKMNWAKWESEIVNVKEARSEKQSALGNVLLKSITIFLNETLEKLMKTNATSGQA